MSDPYKVLGVSPNATDDEIKTAYRELAKKYHPDNYAESPLADLASEKMKEINEAYDTIMNDRKARANNGGYQQNGYGGYQGGYQSGASYGRSTEYSEDVYKRQDVDYIEGLSPAISIDQKTTSKNPRSTVGTVTEIYDYLRLLYARIGIPHCPVCGKEIKQQTIDQIVDQVMALPEGSKIMVLAPVIRGRKGEHVKEFEAARKSGYVRVRVDGLIYDLSETIKLEKNKKHRCV